MVYIKTKVLRAKRRKVLAISVVVRYIDCSFVSFWAWKAADTLQEGTKDVYGIRHGYRKDDGSTSGRMGACSHI